MRRGYAQTPSLARLNNNPTFFLFSKKRQNNDHRMFFTTRAKLFVLFTFASFLAGNVKSDSASGCCASWYGQDDKPCSDCTGTFLDANNFTCRNSIQPGLVESTSGKDCILFTVRNLSVLRSDYIHFSASSNNGWGCPANTTDTDTTPSSALALDGLFGLIFASVVTFLFV